MGLLTMLCQVSIILITRPLNHLLTNNQLIDLLYKQIKNLSSIFSWCNGVKIVLSRKDRVALSHEDIHFFIISS